jgi:hypothetical protein
MKAPKISCNWKLRFHNWKLADVDKVTWYFDPWGYKKTYDRPLAEVVWVCQECLKEKIVTIYWDSFIVLNGGEKIEKDFIEELGDS